MKLTEIVQDLFIGPQQKIKIHSIETGRVLETGDAYISLTGPTAEPTRNTGIYASLTIVVEAGGRTHDVAAHYHPNLKIGTGIDGCLGTSELSAFSSLTRSGRQVTIRARVYGHKALSRILQSPEAQEYLAHKTAPI